MRILISLFVTCIFSVTIFCGDNVKINSITYYGTFLSKRYIEKYKIIEGYYQNQGDDKKIKLPVKIDNWPADEIFDIAPEVVIAKVEIENIYNNSIKDIIFGVKTRYKVSKLIKDKDGEIDLDESEKNQKWEEYFINKKIRIKELMPSEKRIIEIAQINIYNDIEKYDKKEIKPWTCQIEVNINEQNKLKKELEIGFVW